ncbi:MAG: inorganic diphosphatase [Candidatus Omnitrophica bacterium]|nr:inorganic diphosphatase [Candidatus Omnitrophota bacterium]
MKKVLLGLALLAFVLTGVCQGEETSLRPIDGHTWAGERSFLTGYSSGNEDGTVNMVVEIPAGTNEKWEVKGAAENPEGYLKRDFADQIPRVVQYLPYPFNYGMVPNTVLSEESGGDGDPLDVVFLGSSCPRGSVVSVAPIGVIKLVDRGETDDKLIAVAPDGIFGGIHSIQELDEGFPGITAIIETFFLNYKGQGKMTSGGFAGPEEAQKLLNSALVDGVLFSD